jgi:hypothetical protein
MEFSHCPERKLIMEKLKPLSEVCRPDIRYRSRVDLDKATGAISETTIESLYSLIERLTLRPTVPDEVRNHFETAKNLALYSWFVYSFNVVAAMHAFSSLEMALRMKSGEKRSFKVLLDKAFNNRKLMSGLGPPIDLSVALSRMRNDLAHGSRTMHGQGIAVLQMCSELINELFG